MAEHLVTGSAVAFTGDDSRRGLVKHGFLPVMRFLLPVRPPGG
jgi:hypothetical protein